MHLRSSLLIPCLCLLAAGCHRDPYRDVYLDALNTEKRVLEDRLYAAEDNYEQALRQLEACRAQQSPTPATRPTAPRREEPPQPEPDLPAVELPPGFEGRVPPDPGFEIHPASLHRPSEVNSASPGSSEAGEPWDDRPPRDGRVTSIYLHPRRTGGLDLDGQPGDEGLAVLIEPRNELGQYVAQPGPISLVLLDPTRQGDAARFARWDFDREATARMLATGGPDHGLHVCVPWPDRPPQSERMQLFVRYTGQADQEVEATREITLRSASLLADRWTPRAEVPSAQTARSQPPAASPSTTATGVIQASQQTRLPEPATDPPAPSPDPPIPQWRPER